jgi:hypothetical protein
MFFGSSDELNVMARWRFRADWPSTLTIAHHTSVSDVTMAIDLQAYPRGEYRAKKPTTTDDSIQIPHKKEIEVDYFTHIQIF